MAQALVREHPDCHVQTHLSENRDEIAYTCSLYPDAADYTDVYARYGLLTDRSLFGHCIHLSERETDAMTETGSVAVFCPTSNLFLGSGLFPYFRQRRRPVPLRVATATDVGGGTSYSMLRTMDEAYKIIALQGEKLNPLASFWQMTRGNAEALSIADHVGTLDVGTDADLVILDARATPAMALRMEAATTLAEELFLLQTLGDDRAVAEVYVAGRAAKVPNGPTDDCAPSRACADRDMPGLRPRHGLEEVQHAETRREPVDTLPPMFPSRRVRRSGTCRLPRGRVPVPLRNGRPTPWRGSSRHTGCSSSFSTCRPGAGPTESAALQSCRQATGISRRGGSGAGSCQ